MASPEIPATPDLSAAAAQELARQLPLWAAEFGFQGLGITDTNLGAHPRLLARWLEQGHHGDMAWMARHADLRAAPADLLPGTVRIISARMDYLPAGVDPVQVLEDPNQAYIARYALGRDYHKLLRKRLKGLAERLAEAAPHGYRVFTDSAPVLEKPLAAQAGLGWQGKHTLLLHREHGSWFFLGEIFTDLPLPVHQDDQRRYCGQCQACMDICPTNAFTAAGQLDARRCISYLTIEHRGSIPVALRPLLGNRVFGCDDCQLVCPWNRGAPTSSEDDFQPRHQLDAPDLLGLFLWDEQEFLARTEGMAIRRVSHSMWQRNLAVALGNAPSSAAIMAALEARLAACTAAGNSLLADHVQWALERQRSGAGNNLPRGLGPGRLGPGYLGPGHQSSVEKS